MVTKGDKKVEVERRFVPFPKIGHFRDAISTFDWNYRVPKVKTVPGGGGEGGGGELQREKDPVRLGTDTKVEWVGTVKLHGTNAAVAMVRGSGHDDIWAQSRSRILSIGSDNQGFAAHVKTNAKAYKTVLDTIPGHDGDIVVAFGEWCGEGIQKGVAVSKLSKRFVSFDACVVPFEDKGPEPEPMDTPGGAPPGAGKSEEDPSTVSVAETKDETKDETKVGPSMGEGESKGREYEVCCVTKDEGGRVWSTRDVVRALPEVEEASIFNIHTDPTPKWTMTIDMAAPRLKQNELGDLTLAVDKLCPFGARFGVEGNGEGIVWTAIMEGVSHVVRFKVKGEAHTVTKVKKLATVDVEKLTSINDFVEATTTVARMEQAVSTLHPGVRVNMLKRSDVAGIIRWVLDDIEKEDTDILVEAGLTLKQVKGEIGKRVRTWFFHSL